MCGILGTVGYIPDEEAQNKAECLLKNRGPDDRGEWFDRSIPVWLFHRRLSIQDLSERGAQPMVHPDRPGIVITYNGEIYNTRTLRSQLESKGCTFRSTSDTEVLLHAYAVWDVDLLSKIQGMFAFSIWDGYKKRCFLARDPVGQKPLFYSIFNDNLIFGSTSQALRTIDSRPASLCYESLCYILTLGYVPSPYVIWGNMKSLPPGHYLLWSKNVSETPVPYWQPPEQLTRDQANPSDFVSFFSDICREHLISDVPVGLLLSGGLDSSCIASLLSRAGVAKLKTFTLHFADDPKSEAPLAQETSRHLGLENITVDLVMQDADGLREQVARYSSQPQGYSALLTWYHLSQEVARHFKTVLSADGGDELFGGYSWYGSNRFGLAQFKRFLKLYFQKDSLFRKIHHFTNRSLLHAHAMKLFPRFLPEEAASLFAPVGRGFNDEVMLDPLQRYWRKNLPPQNALQRIDLMTFCSGSICAKTDSMSMAHSLEVRAPFLDRRVIDWALSQPAAKYKPGQGKQMIRRAIDGMIPQKVLSHPKQGFSLKSLQTYNFDKLIDEIKNSLMFREGMLAKNIEHFFRRDVPFRNARLWTVSAITRWYEKNALYGK